MDRKAPGVPDVVEVCHRQIITALKLSFPEAQVGFNSDEKLLFCRVAVFGSLLMST